MERALKTYPATWQGQLILACRKCQKKLKHNGNLRELSKLKKIIKRHNREHPEQLLHVINVSCMDLCPKDGITVCCPRHSNRLSILRDVKDLQLLSSICSPSAPLRADKSNESEQKL